MPEQASPVEIIEKRRFLRLNDYFRVSFRSLDRQVSPTGPAPEGVGFSKNVSLGGVCFVADGPAQPGEQLLAHVEIPEIEGGSRWSAKSSAASSSSRALRARSSLPSDRHR